MKNIHILPTDKPSRLYLGNNGNFVFGMMQTSIQSRNDDFTNQNIYITSDEEINGFENNIWVYNNGRVWLWENTMALISDNKPKKIILTTDIRLAPDVQKIDDDFLEWFVKNPSCEEVEVKLENYYASGALQPNLWQHKIIIPKEEPKQGRDKIEDDFLKCLNNSKVVYEPIKETLEEAAERILWDNTGMLIENHPTITQSMIDLAKWQQERSYSEEEVLNFTQTMLMQYKFGNTNIEQMDLLRETFQLFKKK